MIIETTTVSRKLLGKNIEIRVKFTFYKGHGKTRYAPEEPASVEIMSLTTTAFTPQFMANPNWHVLKASAIELEDICEEVLEEKL